MIFDFVKNESVDTLDVVPDAVKPLYEAKDGKFALIPALKPFIAAYTGESTALETVRKDLKAANAESASRRVTGNALVEYLKSVGVTEIDEVDPMKTVSTYVGSLIEGSKKGSEVKVNMDKIKDESEKRIAEVNAAADKKISAMKGVVFRHLGENAAVAAIAEQKGNVDLLKDHVLKQVKVVEDGEEYVVRVVDDKGEVRSNGAGGWLDVKGLVAEMKTKPTFQVLFASESKGGTEHKPGSGKADITKRPSVNGEKTPNQKIAAGLDKMLQSGQKSA